MCSTLLKITDSRSFFKDENVRSWLTGLRSTRINSSDGLVVKAFASGAIVLWTRV